MSRTWILIGYFIVCVLFFFFLFIFVFGDGWITFIRFTDKFIGNTDARTNIRRLVNINRQARREQIYDQLQHDTVARPILNTIDGVRYGGEPPILDAVEMLEINEGERIVEEINAQIQEQKQRQENEIVRDTPFIDEVVREDIMPFLVEALREIGMEVRFLQFTELNPHAQIEEEKIVVPRVLEDVQGLKIRYILDKKNNWKDDSQNVHDYTILRAIIKQYKAIKAENEEEERVEGDSIWRDEKTIYNALQQYMTHKDSVAPQEHAFTEIQVASIRRILDLICLSDVKIFDDDRKEISEKSILIETWVRINSSRNEKNYHELSYSFFSSLLACDDETGPACYIGRTTHISESLAHMDVNPNFGVLLTTASIRNEIMRKAGLIVAKHTSNNSDPIVADFNAGKNTTAVDELKGKIRKELDKLREEYNDHLTKETMDKLFDEIYDVII